MVNVNDGDTITVNHNGNIAKIRLYGIDSPELAQNRGYEARAFTDKLVYRKNVLIRMMDMDNYGRIVGDVYCDGRDINRLLVLSGFAWAYVYHDDKYTGSEEFARKKRAGLWADPSPVPPWDFRQSAPGALR